MYSSLPRATALSPSGNVRGVSYLAFLRSPFRSLSGITLKYCRTFWLDDGGRPFPWVYSNCEVKDFVIHELDHLEMAVFEFLVSLPADDLLLVEMKKTKLDRMMEMMADPTSMAPRSVLPTGLPAATAAAAAVASAAPAGSSANPATPSVQVPPPPLATSKAKKSSSKRERPEGVDVEVEEAAKEDPDADLKQRRCRK
ncbi:hypothetical protein PIB30_080631 [Stylosanthes scabra]|uniref:Peptide deformylase n=1 Tax=Stylosanthes scabra TaxID=79078 RepID=A0ABU6VU34_9FABA|nr:hypothetical protein [Stylosanthes scabra]